MILHKIMSPLAFITLLAVLPLSAQTCLDQVEEKSSHHHHYEPSFGKLSASPTIDNLVIANPQSSLPPVSGWQPFPVDTFSNDQATTGDVATATITVQNEGTYLVNALLTLAYPTPGSNGPNDLTNYTIGIIVNGQLQTDSIGSLHISTEGGKENPGLLFSASLSDLITVPASSTIQFVIAGGTGAASPAYMEVESANATVAQVAR